MSAAYGILSTPAGSVAVLSARGVLPLRGAWAWTVEVDALDEEAPSIGDACALNLGGRVWSGTVRETRVFHGRARLLLEAGYRGGRVIVAPQGYESALLSTLIEVACADGGETLSPLSVPAVVLDRYTRARATLGAVLSGLCEAHGLGWRFSDAGAVVVSAEAWPAAGEVDVLVMGENGADVSAEVAPLAPTLSPGWTFQGRRIERVVYHLPEGSSLTARLVFEREDGAGEMRGLFERAVRSAVRELVYAKRWPAAVVEQDAAGRLSLRPDASSTVAPSAPAPVLYGLPGVRCEVPAGARVGLVHDGASPSEPRAMGWDQATPSTVTEIDAQTIKLGAGATRGVVRLSDLGTAGTWSAIPAGLLYTSPDGLTSWQITGAVSGPAVTFAIVPVTGEPGDMVTKATEASEKVRAE